MLIDLQRNILYFKPNQLSTTHETVTAVHGFKVSKTVRTQMITIGKESLPIFTYGCMV